MADPRPISFWLRLVDSLVNEQFNRTLDEHGVTRIQWQLLNVLASGPKNAIALTTALMPSLIANGDETAVPHIAELVESGWIDELETGFTLSVRGEKARERLSKTVLSQRAAMAADVSAADLATTLKTMAQVARNLGWTE